MRVLSAELQAHLDSGVTTFATCRRIARQDGVTLGFTEHDRDLVFDGTVFRADTGGTLSAIASSGDLAVDNAAIEGALNAEAISAADLAAGRYDGAAIDIWRVNWQAPDERLLLKAGTLGEVSHGPLGYTVEFRGIAHRLNQVAGRLYQHGCDALVGDTRCGVDLDVAAFRGAGTVQTVYGAHEFTASGTEAFADGWFTRGTVRFEDGLLAGLDFSVRAHRAGAGETVFILWQALPAPLSGGETFTVTAGCDKQFETCRNKFANGANFRGFPHVPGNDFITAYPLRGERNDGGKR